MLAKFVIDSHFKSQPKGVNLDDKSKNESEEDIQVADREIDPEVRIRDPTQSFFQFLLVLLKPNYLNR